MLILTHAPSPSRRSNEGRNGVTLFDAMGNPMGSLWVMEARDSGRMVRVAYDMPSDITIVRNSLEYQDIRNKA